MDGYKKPNHDTVSLVERGTKGERSKVKKISFLKNGRPT
jgi:hypothetical protein